MYLLSRQETFKESDLKNFQEVIEKWTNLFIKLFDQFSNSDFKLPKLHSWVHHIVDTIREFRAINGYTTETYEALHKTYVKISYRLSNKKNVEEQMIKTIRRKAIIKQNDFKKKFKTPLKFNYSSKLFEFDISEAFEFIDKYKNKTNLDKKMIKSLDHFIQSLDSYFDLLKISTAQDCHIKIYRSVTLENRVILRTTNMFHKRLWFSNISVTMNDEELFEYQFDNGICYTQTLLITEVFLKKEKSLHLALVQWYDFISKRIPFVYGCPLLKLTEVYNFIEIEAIEDIVHIVPRFNKTNEYLNHKQFASLTTPTTLAATTSAATTPAATTPAATTPTATTPTTPTTPTMPIVLIKSEEVAEASSRKKQKTVVEAIKNYSDDDSLFTHKDANYFLNKFEEMNSRQIEIIHVPKIDFRFLSIIEMNNRQIKIEREISDIWKLLASSGIESDYTTENKFINKFVQKVANFAIDKRIYLDESYLKSVAASCTELEFCEYFGGWENKYWSSYYTEYIQSPLLAKHRSLRGSITNRVRSVLFAVFGEHKLPYIDTKSALQEIKE
ncbi:hypothetical protein Glove_26g84 [Diversispora epigaea]|uniref:Uncharacterized protein n=1 Tax=Diversispora epigaea TaxID=1348612 RepID=A0A397JIF3_9GLOM|nr:hypothetical protein Glove_26g84 [Diversispora epigaea]